MCDFHYGKNSFHRDGVRSSGKDPSYREPSTHSRSITLQGREAAKGSMHPIEMARRIMDSANVPMTGTTRVRVAAIKCLMALIAVACSGRSGIETLPDPTTLEPYNGHWVLEEADLPPSGGYRFAARKGETGEPDAEAFSVVLVAQTERFTLALDDSVFRVSGAESSPSFTLPVGGDRVRVHYEALKADVSVRLTWSGSTPVVEQRLPDNSVVFDRYEVTATGTLVVTRTARLGTMETRDSARLVYRRSDTPGNSSYSGIRSRTLPGGAE